MNNNFGNYGQGYSGGYDQYYGGTPPYQDGQYGEYQQQQVPPMAHYGYQPIAPVLPHPMPGYQWATVPVMVWKEFTELPDGSFGPGYAQEFRYQQFPIPQPIIHHHSAYPVPFGEEEEKGFVETAEKVEKATSTVVEKKDSSEGDIDEEGDYGDGGVLVLNPSMLLHSPLTAKESQLTSPSFSPLASTLVTPVKAPEPNHAKALNNYNTRFRKRVSQQYPARRGAVYAVPGEKNYGRWKDAALHLLPLKIIDRLQQLVHFKSIREGDYENCPKFLIPCSVTSHQGFELKDAVIEFTISPSGKPLHLFLRPLEGRDEVYLERNLDTHKETYEKAQQNASFPSLSSASKHKKVRDPSVGKPADDGVYMTFLSEYGLKIKIHKK